MTDSKGQITKQNILKEGLKLASVRGLVNISIGGLAEKAQMSRSGLFAHFMSKEQLQLEILEYANELLINTLFRPCKDIESPRDRLAFLMERLPVWFEFSDPKVPGGCIFIMACIEFDDRPGRVRDYLYELKMNLINIIKKNVREAIEAKEFDGTLDEEEFAFVFYSLYLGYHQYKKFFCDARARNHVIKHMRGLLEFASGQMPHSATSSVTRIEPVS